MKKVYRNYRTALNENNIQVIGVQKGLKNANSRKPIQREPIENAPNLGKYANVQV